MSNKRNKTRLPEISGTRKGESSGTRKSPPVSSYENPVKRQQLFNRLSSGGTSGMDESLELQRTAEKMGYSQTPLFLINKEAKLNIDMNKAIEDTTVARKGELEKFIPEVSLGVKNMKVQDAEERQLTIAKVGKATKKLDTKQ
ncbi:hypothetical protein HPULCUR_002003 [Helicostylum pulchrum]|uniref:Uncharacterized protein n=1 Tax=Helicostylum pulchrum TaxID=562976 RepID=A0ABP9XQL4_9FUNG